MTYRIAKMLPILRITGAWCCLLFAATASQSADSTFPAKPVRIVTGQSGGSPDMVSRVLSQGLAARVSEQVIVDNRPTGNIPAELVSHAAPDGYTLLVTSNVLWIGPLLQATSYDAGKDFAPVILAARAPNVLVVHPSLPARSVKELIAIAKARPGELNYASSASGTSSHLAAELFNYMARVKITRIPYKGAGVATNDLITGQVHLSFFTATSVMPHVRAGRLRALAVTSRTPFNALPDLPTVAASGLPGYESSSIYAVFAPARTPDAIVAKLNREIAAVLNAQEVKTRFANIGAEVASSSPVHLAEAMRSETSTMRKVIAAANLRTD
jgi:tripartite-type tricarboxylate transporter receptor subunit TctC